MFGKIKGSALQLAKSVFNRETKEELKKAASKLAKSIVITLIVEYIQERIMEPMMRKVRVMAEADGRVPKYDVCMEDL